MYTPRSTSLTESSTDPRRGARLRARRGKGTESYVFLPSLCFVRAFILPPEIRGRYARIAPLRAAHGPTLTPSGCIKPEGEEAPHKLALHRG